MNRRLCLFMCSLVAPGVYAEPPALGRLFYTPAERAQMEEAQPESVTATHYQGMVESSDGRRTVWINGQAQSEATPPEQQTIGGGQDELLRGGRIVVHPQK
ncbi:MAG: hypothetical protein LBU53_04315 [Zoogloeaceae bacterium]|jgi:hypothetical protein|nr:hypothetical protein [Zoogloeaceae bacterium]